MAAISTRSPGIAVEYDCLGKRVVKTFAPEELYKARRLYAEKLEGGKNPKLRKVEDVKEASNIDDESALSIEEGKPQGVHVMNEDQTGEEAEPVLPVEPPAELPTVEELEARAERLSRLAESEVVPPRVLTRQRYASLLTHFDLTPELLTDAMIERAEVLIWERKQAEIKRRGSRTALAGGYYDLYAELGCNPLHLLRWMGADAWLPEEASVIAAYFGIQVSAAQIKQCLLEGRRGLPKTALTQEQAEELYEKLEGIPLENPTTPG